MELVEKLWENTLEGVLGFGNVSQQNTSMLANCYGDFQEKVKRSGLER